MLVFLCSWCAKRALANVRQIELLIVTKKMCSKMLRTAFFYCYKFLLCSGKIKQNDRLLLRLLFY